MSGTLPVQSHPSIDETRERPPHTKQFQSTDPPVDTCNARKLSSFHNKRHSSENSSEPRTGLRLHGYIGYDTLPTYLTLKMLIHHLFLGFVSLVSNGENNY